MELRIFKFLIQQVNPARYLTNPYSKGFSYCFHFRGFITSTQLTLAMPTSPLPLNNLDLHFHYKWRRRKELCILYRHVKICEKEGNQTIY